VVEYGTGPQLGTEAIGDETGILHHVQVPLPESGSLHYRVRTGNDTSAVHKLREAPSDEFRVVVIGDAGYAKNRWGAAVLKEKPHLLLTAGDNVASLHSGTPVNRDDHTAFSRLIDADPELFQTTPILPALGNHDREFRPRGPKPPAEPVYDIEASAFRSFFALPGDEWIWTFAVPKFGVRFAALDLNHLSDFGTTWQTCHPWQRGTEQFNWYQKLSAMSRDPFLITIYNEQNSRVRGLEDGEWGRMIRRGTLAITGYGYFAERAEVDGFSFYNTCLDGTGDKYADPKSQLLESADNYVVLTFRPGAPLKVDFKRLDGGLIDSREFKPRF
jgi:hypothetical protein